MKLFLRFLFAAVCAASFIGALTAAEVGGAAPPLQISDWIKGKPVTLATDGSNTTFVVEFWATWCPPCLANIPHMIELQQTFRDKGVVFVSISSEDAATVQKFIRRKETNVNYTIAVDDYYKTTSAYMGESERNYIPVAFIVNKGRIMWKGNGYPMVNLERSLDEILAGTFDIELGRKREIARQKLNDFMQQASMIGDEEKLSEMASEIGALDKEVGGIIPGSTFNTAELLNTIKFRKTLDAYQKAVLFGGDDAQIEQLDRDIERLAPASFDVAEFRRSVDLIKTFDRYFLAVTGQSDTNQIAGLTKKISETTVKNARLLNQFAWMILTDERIQSRNAELAAKLARSAVDATDAGDIMPLHTYARALFESGRAAEAVTWEKKALELADNDPTRNEIADTIRKYEGGVARQ